MEAGVLKYQYDNLMKQLMLLQDHAAARSCPYSQNGEMCIRKHLMTVEAYALETLPMEDKPEYKQKLKSLESEANEYRMDQENVLCGVQDQFLDGLGEWARKWRKDFEMHCLLCELEKTHPKEETTKEKVEATVNTGGNMADSAKSG